MCAHKLQLGRGGVDSKKISYRSQRKNTTQTKNVIKRVHAVNLTEVLIVMAGSNTNNLAFWGGKYLVKSTKYYTDGKMYTCAIAQQLKIDVPKNARELRSLIKQVIILPENRPT